MAGGGAIPFNIKRPSSRDSKVQFAMYRDELDAYIEDWAKEGRERNKSRELKLKCLNRREAETMYQKVYNPKRGWVARLFRKNKKAKINKEDKKAHKEVYIKYYKLQQLSVLRQEYRKDLEQIEAMLNSLKSIKEKLTTLQENSESLRERLEKEIGEIKERESKQNFLKRGGRWLRRNLTSITDDLVRKQKELSVEKRRLQLVKIELHDAGRYQGIANNVKRYVKNSFKGSKVDSKVKEAGREFKETIKKNFGQDLERFSTINKEILKGRNPKGAIDKIEYVYLSGLRHYMITPSQGKKGSSGKVQAINRKKESIYHTPQKPVQKKSSHNSSERSSYASVTRNRSLSSLL